MPILETLDDIMFLKNTLVSVPAFSQPEWSPTLTAFLNVGSSEHSPPLQPYSWYFLLGNVRSLQAQAGQQSTGNREKFVHRFRGYTFHSALTSLSNFCKSQIMPSDFSSLRVWMSPWVVSMLPVQSWSYLQSINKCKKYPVNSPPWRWIYLQPLPDTHHPSEPSKVWVFKNILSRLYYFYLWEGYSSITIMRNRISPNVILNLEILMIS